MGDFGMPWLWENLNGSSEARNREDFPPPFHTESFIHSDHAILNKQLENGDHLDTCPRKLTTKTSFAPGLGFFQPCLPKPLCLPRHAKPRQHSFTLDVYVSGGPASPLFPRLPACLTNQYLT